MNTLIADNAMAEILRQAKDLAEIRDAGGHVIGFFAPVTLQNAALYAQGAAHFNPEEIQRRKDQKAPGHSTQEVLENLRTLEKSPWNTTSSGITGPRINSLIFG